MKRIPALLLSIAFYISITILYHYSLSLSPVHAETIDITPTPEYGDTIPIDTSLNRQGGIDGEIGPKRNRVKFPDLSKEEGFYSKEDGLFNALPEGIQQDLKFTDPTQQQIKDRFGGKIAHPLCNKAKIIKIGEETEEIETGDPIIQSNPVPFTPTEDFFQTILKTRFWQSILVPQKGSDLNFSLDAREPTVSNKVGCNPDSQGKTAEAVPVQNDPPASLNFLGSLFENVLGFLKDFFAGIFEGGARVVANVEQTKYLPGETVLADQTVGQNGFLNFFKPEGAEFTNQGDQEEQVAYKVLKDDRNIGVTYKGVSSLKSGTLDLVKSLYPEGMAPTSLAAVTPSTPGSIPPGPLATTLPIPKSQKLVDLVKQAATSFGTPVPVLAAVAWVEGVGMWNYTDGEIEQYSTPGAKSPLNPEPNGCTAAGPMQFVIGGYASDCGPLYTGKILGSVWDGYKNAVNEATGENRTTDYRNIKDSIYAAAKKLQEGSGMPRNNSDWDEQAVRNSIRSWYGSCLSDNTTDNRFGKGKSFCDFVWEAVVQSRQPF